MDAAYSCVSNSPTRPLLDGLFQLRFFDEVGEKSRSKILKIEDRGGLVVGQVRILISGSDNRGSSIDLSGGWCRYYWPWTASLLASFGIPLDRPKFLQRVDYCFDFAAALPMVKGLLKPCFKVGKQGRKVQDGRLVHLKKESKRFAIVLYDKKLDILENGLDKEKPSFPCTERPAFDYPYLMKLGSPVTRFEFRLLSEFFLEEAFTISDVIRNAFGIFEPRLTYWLKDYGEFRSSCGSELTSGTFNNLVLKTDLDTDLEIKKRAKTCKTMLYAWVVKSFDIIGPEDTLKIIASCMSNSKVNADLLPGELKRAILASQVFDPFSPLTDGCWKE